jgi:putative DNA primase/helicase
LESGVSGSNDETPNPAQKVIIDAIENAPAFSDVDAAPEAVPADGEQPAKRGRGRPRKDAGAPYAGAGGDGGGAPPAGGPDAVWPPSFEMRESGLWHCPKGDDPVWICAPFQVLGLVRTADAQGWALYLSFADPDGGAQSLAIPYAELQGDGAVIRRQLADLGFVLSTWRGAREKFIAALASVRTSRRLLRVSQTGWAADGRVFALPHKTIAGPDAEAVVFEGRARGAHFGEAGDLAGWRANVAALAKGQDRLLLALALALSGPLLEPLGMDGGGFHFVGGSSIGKTSAERLAGTCWGGCGTLGFAQSWRATANSLEGIAAAHNDCFLALDEIGLIEPHDLSAAVYALAGGEGKGRMRSDAEMRNRARWRIALLSSGEVSLAARIAEGSGRSKARAGQAVRIVDLEADAGRGHGIFDDPGSTGNARDLADAIREATKAHYGVAGPAFVELLLNRRDETIATARAIMKAFVADHVPDGANGQVARVAQRFAHIAAAGEIATAAKILPFESGAVLNAVARLFKVWIAARGGLGASESRAAVEAMRQFIQAHSASRFIKIGERSDGEDHVNTSFRYQNAAGWRHEKDKGTFYYFNDAGWQEALTGMERRAAAEALFAAGFLLKDADGKTKRAERIDGKTRRVFVIREEILEGDDHV